MGGYFDQIDWEEIVLREIAKVERHFGFEVILDTCVLAEVAEHTKRLLERQCPGFKPNVAKLAGAFTFWFRKLKPVSFPPEAKNRYLAVNEFVALMVGLGICEEYRDDFSDPGFSVEKIETRLLYDWVNSLRLHSHSPNSTVMAFELIATAGAGCSGGGCGDRVC